MPLAVQRPVVIAEIHGVKVPDSAAMDDARIAALRADRFEAQKISGMLAALQDGDRVLEIGAGSGLVGATAAGSGKTDAVLSFEADGDLVPHIRELHAFNDLTDRIELRHAEVSGDAFDDLRQSFRPTLLVIDMNGGELEFLRQATLDGLRAVVVVFHPEVYGNDGMQNCKNILRQHGFRKTKDASTRRVWTCTFVPGALKPSVHGGWTTQYRMVRDAVVVPPTQPGFEQPAGVLDRDGDHCADGVLWRHGRVLTTAPDIPEGTIATRAGTWIWGGVLWAHFGHFLVESTARLWVLDQLETPVDGILFVPKRPRKGVSTAGYQHEFIRLMGTEAPLVCLDAPCRVERLIVPGQGFGLGPLIKGTQAFRDAIARNFARDVAADGPDKLYISRSQLGAGKGNLIGETALEAALEAEGYTIFHPEKHDLRTQIARYKSARRVIAAEGSALHLLALVAPADQQVAIVVRRLSVLTRQIKKHLVSFAAITPVTMSHLTTSWKPSPKARPRLWMGELDMPALQAHLVQEGFIGKSRHRWQSLDPQAVQAQLGPGFEPVA